MDLTETVYVGDKWIHLAQSNIHQQVLLIR